VDAGLISLGVEPGDRVSILGENRLEWLICHLATMTVGGLLLGVAESLAGGYITVAFKNTLAFLVIILILLIRPEGLLGTEFKERV
jgi:long-subunit acyl-CoA synthetase (AMP-forming)